MVEIEHKPPQHHIASFPDVSFFLPSLRLVSLWGLKKTLIVFVCVFVF